MDIFIHYGMAAGDPGASGLRARRSTPDNAERIGVQHRFRHRRPADDRGYAQRLSSAGGPRKISPFFIPGTIINMISGNLSIMFGFKGPNLAVVTACTTGLHAIGDAASA